jgi:hypothetical protein
MSRRRSPLHTVLRVAQIRENAARGDVALALARHNAAIAEAANWHKRITNPQRPVDGKTLACQLAAGIRIAQIAAAADSAVEGADLARTHALQDWAAAAGKRSSMEDLLAGHTAQVDREDIATQQRAMDDRGARGRRQ